MVFRVMSQVSEVKVHGIGDADFALRHSESFHEVHGVGVGSVGGSEAGHGDADNSSSVTLEAVESVDGNQERECGVKSSADAEGDGFGFGVFNSSGESFALNEKNLLTAVVKFRSFRNEGAWVNGACQAEGDVAVVGFQFHFFERHVELSGGTGCCESGVHASFCTEQFHVDFSRQELFLHGETLSGAQHFPVFGDEGSSAEDEVLGALAIAGTGIDVSRHEACALVADE